MRVLVVYDISDDKRRSKVFKTLAKHGLNIQFSCFEIEVTKEELTSIISKIKKIIDKEEDKVFFFPISKYASPYIVKMGKAFNLGDSITL